MILRERSCVRGVLYDAAACVNSPPTAAFTVAAASLTAFTATTAGASPPLLRLHLVADDMNATSHTQNLVWRDRSSFGNDLTPHLAAPEVIEDAFNGHKALPSDSRLVSGRRRRFQLHATGPRRGDNLLTYGESHWSFPGVTAFAVIEPRDVPWGDGDPLDFVFDFGEFPARGFGLAWHENERTLYTPTDHGGEVVGAPSIVRTRSTWWRSSTRSVRMDTCAR